MVLTHVLKAKHFIRFCLIYFGIAVLIVSGASVSAQQFNIEDTANTIFKAFTKYHQIEASPEVNSEVALAVQDFYIALLRPTWGMDVGYIAQIQKTDSNSSPPVTGILLENMFTGTRAVIDRTYGVQMRAAGEILFRVGSDEINVASTRDDALNALKSVVPAVRLSDTLIAMEEPRSQSVNSATNLEVRFCVLGGELMIHSNDDWVEKLANFSVRLLDQNKEQIGVSESFGSMHPLDAVIIMLDALHARGIQLREDDLLAVGTLTDSYSVEGLSRLRAVFEGLSEEEMVSVYMGFR